MGLTREPIYTALLGFINAAATWRAPVTRRFRSIGNVGAPEMPTGFLICGKQTPIAEVRGQAYKWKLRALLVAYARTDDPSQAPSSLLNPIIDAIELALEQGAGDGFPSQGSPGQLGLANVLATKMVDVEIVEGSEDGQGSLMIELEILCVA